MIYNILIDLWINYINPIIPDYIDVMINVLSFILFLAVFGSPFLFAVLVIKWIPNAIKGGKRYD